MRICISFPGHADSEAGDRSFTFAGFPSRFFYGLVRIVPIGCPSFIWRVIGAEHCAMRTILSRIESPALPDKWLHEVIDCTEPIGLDDRKLTSCPSMENYRRVRPSNEGESKPNLLCILLRRQPESFL